MQQDFMNKLDIVLQQRVMEAKSHLDRLKLPAVWIYSQDRAIYL